MSAGRRSHRREVGRPLGSSVRAQGVAGGHFEVADAARRVRIHGGGLCPYWAESGMAALVREEAKADVRGHKSNGMVRAATDCETAGGRREADEAGFE
jgi:hypothetical protein